MTGEGINKKVNRKDRGTFRMAAGHDRETRKQQIIRSSPTTASSITNLEIFQLGFELLDGTVSQL